MPDGRRAGAISVLGIEAGGLCHVAASALGLSAFLGTSASTFTLIKDVGAAHLVFLGGRSCAEREVRPKLRSRHVGCWAVPFQATASPSACF